MYNSIEERKYEVVKKKIFWISAVMLLLLGGCSSKNDSSSSFDSEGNSSSLGTNDHYHEDNFIASSETVTKTRTRFYEGPSLLTSSTKVGVFVEGEELFVYETRVNHRRKFTWETLEDTNPVAIFDFEGRVSVDIEIKEDVVLTSASVSPLVYGIEPVIEGNHIRFDLEYTDNYVVEYNGDSDQAIHLFTSGIEEEPITQEEADADDSIVYIGPGVYEAGAIPLKSHQTLYISGGAVVYGQIRTENLTNITIKGRGILSGAVFDRRTENEYTIPVEIRSSDHIVIEDLTFLDPAGWCIALYKSSDITLNNVKIVTARPNGDGISVQSCSDVQVNGGFVRTWDDSLVVKNVDRGSTENITFDGVSVWTDLAQSMEVGYETYGPTMNNIRFQNITILHNFHKPAISLHNCDDAEISGVYYQNITLEDGKMLGDDQNDGENDFFLDMTIAYNAEWTKSQGERGSVDGVYIDNVKVYSIADSCISRLAGESTASMIRNVRIGDIDYAGKTIRSADDLSLGTNQYVSGVSFTGMKSADEIRGAYKNLPYRLVSGSEDAEIAIVENIVQDGVLVPDFARLNGELSFIGVKADVGAYSGISSHGAGNKATTPGDDGSGTFERAAHEGALAFDGKEETYYENDAWRNEENEFAALTIDFGENLHTIGVIRILGPQDNAFKYTYTISVYGRKIKNDGTVNPNYTRILSNREYVMSPSSGNAIDINISTQEYAGMQLRFYRTDGLTAPESYRISEIEFYPPSLTFGKSIYGATMHNDVYPVTNVVDGEVNGTSYYESKTLPAQLIIDLEDVYALNKIILSLSPSLLWEARVQNIEISVSADNRGYDEALNFTTLFEATDYLFDPQTGNRITLNVDDVQARYLKIVIHSNSAGNYGGQLAEVSAYGNQ